MWRPSMRGLSAFKKRDKNPIRSNQLDLPVLVEHTYNAILLRPADDAGRNYWIGCLESSTHTFKDLLSHLLSSEEFASQLQRFADAYGARDRLPFFNEYSQYGEVSLLLVQMINTGARHRIVVDV